GGGGTAGRGSRRGWPRCARRRPAAPRPPASRRGTGSTTVPDPAGPERSRRRRGPVGGPAGPVRPARARPRAAPERPPTGPPAAQPAGQPGTPSGGTPCPGRYGPRVVGRSRSAGPAATSASRFDQRLAEEPRVPRAAVVAERWHGTVAARLVHGDR